MPTLTVTPFDPNEGTSSCLGGALPVQARLRRVGRLMADLWYILFSTSGFMASSIVMSIGLMMVFFIALTGGDLNLLAIGFANLGEHFQSADGAARNAFAEDVKWAFLTLLAIVHLARMPGWFARLWDGLDRGNTNEASAVQ